MIRLFRESDRAQLKTITAEVFGPAAVDFYLERRFGPIHGRDWAWRKVRHVDPAYPDLARRAGVTGIVVLECVSDREGVIRKVYTVKDTGSFAGDVLADLRPLRSG